MSWPYLSGLMNRLPSSHQQLSFHTFSGEGYLNSHHPSLLCRPNYPTIRNIYQYHHSPNHCLNPKNNNLFTNHFQDKVIKYIKGSSLQTNLQKLTSRNLLFGFKNHSLNVHCQQSQRRNPNCTTSNRISNTCSLQIKHNSQKLRLSYRACTVAFKRQN